MQIASGRSPGYTQLLWDLLRIGGPHPALMCDGFGGAAHRVRETLVLSDSLLKGVTEDTEEQLGEELHRERFGGF